MTCDQYITLKVKVSIMSLTHHNWSMALLKWCIWERGITAYIGLAWYIVLQFSILSTILSTLVFILILCVLFRNHQWYQSIGKDDFYNDCMMPLEIRRKYDYFNFRKWKEYFVKFEVLKYQKNNHLVQIWRQKVWSSNVKFTKIIKVKGAAVWTPKIRQ